MLPVLAERGVALVSLVVALTLMAVLGTAVLSFLSIGTQNQLLANSSERALLLAQSGTRLVGSVTVDTTETLTMANGDQIVIDRTVSPNTSTGKVAIDTPFKAIRVCTANPAAAIVDQIDDLQFDEDGDATLDETWQEETGTGEIRSTGPSDGEPAVRVKGEEVLLSVLWQDKDWLDFEQVWEAAGQLLSYELQVKTKVLIQGNMGEHYLIGLSFRLNATSESSYGISFFSSESGSTPDWLSTANGLAPLRQDGLHLVLWEKTNGGPITVLDSKKMQAGDGVLDGTDVKDWSTIVVRVEEQLSGPGGTRENHISAFVQGTTLYPRNADVDWDHGTFNTVVWQSEGDTTVTDATHTTENFDTRPAEIGVHAFYDAPANNQQMFDDFRMHIIE
ncbi:MAG: hypothetical protein HN742_41320 [Lentisphaerae bacterium]|nr:hypothetical protein [Lentisphaerota bacterium]MBT4817487.1 hypothetical protein [Lentisphaerota bacterium]MBT5612730.1 hypothetical protein [Lentisphaerota bacterium]MBT7058959.1 hypothetical protein [Lentisphaerota bacterium]MBT7848379.1 hypothetical protein [Lentisphaerota bacterium]